MKKLEDRELIQLYYDKYKLSEIFSKDIIPYLELFAYEKNEHICTDNHRLQHILFLVKGKAKVYKSLANGRSLLLCFYSPLKVLGDLELVNPAAAPSNVQALEQVYCVGFHLKHVKGHLANDLTFYKFICTSLGEKLDRSSINSSINLLNQLENRLASYILATAEQVQRNNLTIHLFNENLSNTAELLGTSYRHLLRTLSSLCANNVLRKLGSGYEVINIARLEELASDVYK